MFEKLSEATSWPVILGAAGMFLVIAGLHFAKLVFAKTISAWSSPSKLVPWVGLFAGMGTVTAGLAGFGDGIHRAIAEAYSPVSLSPDAWYSGLAGAEIGLGVGLIVSGIVAAGISGDRLPRPQR